MNENEASTDTTIRLAIKITETRRMRPLYVSRPLPLILERKCSIAVWRFPERYPREFHVVVRYMPNVDVVDWDRRYAYHRDRGVAKAVPVAAEWSAPTP